MDVPQDRNQNTFTLQTTLSSKDYEAAEIHFEKNNIKNCSIYHHQKCIAKLQFIYENYEETRHLFRQENNFNMEIPDALNPNMIPHIVHYLYFKEVKTVPFGEIVDFLDLAIFFKIKDLIQRIVEFLKEVITTVKQAVFLRIALLPLLKRADCRIANLLKEILAICETFLLENDHMKDSFSFYLTNGKIMEVGNEKMNTEMFRNKSESEMKIDLIEKESEEKKRKKGVGKNIIFFMGAILICICIMLVVKNKEEPNVLELKKINQKHFLIHENENENDLESESTLEFLESLIERERKNYEKKLLTLRNEHEKQLEIFKRKLEFITKAIKKQEDKDKDRQVLKLEGLLKMMEIEPDMKKQAAPCTQDSEQAENETWKKNALLCMNDNQAVLLCLKNRLKEEAALAKLKEESKTINSDHEKHFKYLAELLSFKSLDELQKNIHLLFRASEHEMNIAKTFHEICDGKGPTITIIRSEYKKLFGGYASKSWNSDGWSSAPGSFLFSLDNQTKHVIIQNENLALRGNKDYGPSFGGSDIVLSYSRGDIFDPTRPNWSDLGFTYSLPNGISFESNEAQSYLAGAYRFKVDEYEVFGMGLGSESFKPPLLTQLKSMIKTVNQDYEKHFKYIAELLNFKNLEELTTKLHLLFRASEHSFSKDKFHELCDGKGPTIIIIRSDSKKFFGGYASISWSSDNTHSSAPDSFLFSLDKHTKHTIYKNEQYALRGNANLGPCFGQFSDLMICYGSDCRNWSDLGGTYSLPEGVSYNTDEARSYLGGSEKFKTEEYEVFKVDMNSE